MATTKDFITAIYERTSQHNININQIVEFTLIQANNNLHISSTVN